MPSWGPAGFQQRGRSDLRGETELSVPLRGASSSGKCHVLPVNRPAAKVLLMFTAVSEFLRADRTSREARRTQHSLSQEVQRIQNAPPSASLAEVLACLGLWCHYEALGSERDNCSAPIMGVGRRIHRRVTAIRLGPESPPRASTIPLGEKRDTYRGRCGLRAGTPDHVARLPHQRTGH